MSLVDELRKPVDKYSIQCYNMQFGFGVECDHNCIVCHYRFSNKLADLIEKYYVPKSSDADGEPIEVGDVVYLVNNDKEPYGTPRVVSKVDGVYVDFEDGGFGRIFHITHRKPTALQDAQQNINSYLESNAVTYMQSKGNGVYEDVKMIPLDVAENALYMQQELCKKGLF